MLDILVVGAGIAGLSAAIALRRAGHRVRVFERSSFKNETGAAINVPPNASRHLIAWGLDPEEFRFVRCRNFTYMDPFTLAVTTQLSLGDMARDIGGADLFYAHRVDLHDALRLIATRQDGPGVPVTIKLEAKVVGYDPSRPAIRLQGNREVVGDVVIGSDGLHSAASEAVAGQQHSHVPSEYSNYCYRFLIPATTLAEDPETRFWNEERDGWFRLLPHNETKRRIVAYPCRDNKIHNFVLLFHAKDGELGGSKDYHESVQVSDVLDRFSDFSPRLLQVMSKASEAKTWPLLTRDPLLTWHNGCMALAGDAAHPMLPHQGQGGAQGFEDGIALGIALCGASGHQDIEKRLQIYSGVRRKRATVIQLLSQVGQDQVELVHDELLPYMNKDEIPTSLEDIYRHNYAYDVVRETVDAMTRHDPSFQLPHDFFENKGECEGAGREIRSKAKQ